MELIMKKSILKTKKFRYGINASILTALFIVLILVLNIVVGLFTDKFPNFKVDLSSNKLFSISNETKQAIPSVDKDVHIFVLQAGPAQNTYFDVILSKYRQLNSNISYSYEDPTKDPTYWAKYAGQLDYSGSFVVESGDRGEIISFADFIGQDGRYADAENYLTNAILSVTLDERKNIIFTQGHDESEFKSFKGIAERKYINTARMDIKLGIPEDTNMIVIGAPKSDFTQAELNVIDTYVKGGGNIAVFLDPNAPYPINLCSYIKEWGIEVMDEMVEEKNPSYVMAQYGGFVALPRNTIYVSQNTENILYTPAFRMSTLFTDTKGVTVEEVLTTTGNAVSTTGAAGPFGIMSVSTKYIDDTNTVKMVVSSSKLNYDVEFENQYVGNTKLANGILAGVLKSNNIVQIQSKTSTLKSLKMTVQNLVILSIILIIIAIGILALGIVVWYRRRHL